jgi:hypothetical protein
MRVLSVIAAVTASIAALIVFVRIRRARSSRALDAGSVSSQWIAQHRASGDGVGN